MQQELNDDLVFLGAMRGSALRMNASLNGHERDECENCRGVVPQEPIVETGSDTSRLVQDYKQMDVDEHR